MPPRKPGPTEVEVIADLEHYQLERFPTARPLAASARVLARQMDTNPTAAVARELRLILAALAEVTADQQNDDMAAFLAEIAAPPFLPPILDGHPLDGGAGAGAGGDR